MTTTLIERDVLEILQALPSKSVHLFHLNIIQTDALSQVSMNGIPTVLYRTPPSWISYPSGRKGTTGFLIAHLRRSAQPVRRFASARSDTSPQNGCCKVPVSTIWLPLIRLLLAAFRYQLVPVI
ncbi:MAG: hypothetical protein DMG06_23050 [Acidobacteria bacterium]|nr:MAG: hypothetical protein DMG06_23050 [Acidobacteriota bacterium]